MQLNLYARESGTECQMRKKTRSGRVCEYKSGKAGKLSSSGVMMGYGKKYGALLEGIAAEADAIAMKYFRTREIGAEKKGDGTVVTIADKTVEAMALRKVAESGLAIDVVGEETSKEAPKEPAAAKSE